MSKNINYIQHLLVELMNPSIWETKIYERIKEANSTTMVLSRKKNMLQMKRENKLRLEKIKSTYIWREFQNIRTR